MKKLAAILAISMFAPFAARADLAIASLSTVTTDIAKAVGGDKVNVIPVIKPGIDPHDFQPTPDDVKQIVTADLVLITGKHLAGYLTKLEESAGGAGKFVDTGAAFPSLKLEEDGKLVEDPHWWHSIDNVKKATAVVKERFMEADPANKATFEKNAAAYIAQLKDLEAWAKREIATLPREKRKLVTTHDAFQYFARDFGFRIYRHPEKVLHVASGGLLQVSPTIVGVATILRLGGFSLQRLHHGRESHLVGLAHS